MTRCRWQRCVEILVVFLIAFLPRAIYPISRPTQWYTRSVMFIQSVLDGDWGETAYSEHPGVTTMWLSGVALRLAGVAPEQRPEGLYVDPDSLTARESAIGVLPLALVSAALIELAYLLLVRLFNRTVAFSAALLVALDPFFLANSKVMHVDGLLAAFMCSSALALLLFVSERRWRWVVLAGVLAGLALLTKSPALFLWPFTALCLGVSTLVAWAEHLRNPQSALRTPQSAFRIPHSALPTPHSAFRIPHSAFHVGGLWRLARRNVLAGLAWLGSLVLVYWTLFPAMWVHPVETLKSVYARALLRVGWAHPNPIYFLGRAFIGDPGPTYYLYTWGYKVTSVVAVFALVALLVAAFGKGIPRHKRMMVGLILAFAFFFTIQMMLGAKKMPRYLLPAFPMVDVLAGVGLVWWAECIAYRLSQITNRKSANLHSSFSRTLIAAGLLIQALLVLPRHPYYDTYFSELAGGARAGIAALSTQWQGEGLDLAARRLNALPEAGQQTVGSHRAALFHQYFVGQAVDVQVPADWYVLGIHNVLKGGEEGEEQAVDFYRRRQAWDSVAFDGIPYVWIYRAATGPDHPVAFTFEHGIQLVGYDVAPPPYHPGQTLRLQVYWLAQQRPAEDYTVFVHLLDGAGQLVAQQDNPPVRGTRPTSTWEPGAVIVDPYDLSIPDDAVPGRMYSSAYTLMVGLYRWPDLTRLPVRNQEGTALPDDRALLATVNVEREPRAPAAVWVARGLACLVVLSAVVGFRRQRG
ncbi:MAG TPA: glycosyltransferase family 39 protein [Anaerolineae bacterium]|nr:glycosyltransferase family 39 protein [Anaerolineae bacterium]